MKIPRVKQTRTNVIIESCEKSFGKFLQNFEVKLEVKVDRSVNVTRAIVVSKIVAKNVTQRQSEDERLARRQTKKTFFTLQTRDERRVFPFAADTTKRFSCVYLLFLLFSIFIARAAAKRKKKEKQTTARGKIGSNVKKKHKVNAGGGRGIFRVRGGKVSAKFPAFVQNVFLSSTMDLSFFFLGKH